MATTNSPTKHTNTCSKPCFHKPQGQFSFKQGAISSFQCDGLTDYRVLEGWSCIEILRRSQVRFHWICTCTGRSPQWCFQKRVGFVSGWNIGFFGSKTNQNSPHLGVNMVEIKIMTSCNNNHLDYTPQNKKNMEAGKRPSGKGKHIYKPHQTTIFFWGGGS